MERDPFSYKYPLKLNSLNICEYIPQIVVAPSCSSGNNYQPFKTSRVTATSTGDDTSTNTTTEIDSKIATAIGTLTVT
jgi:hypothetical protein